MRTCLEEASQWEQSDLCWASSLRGKNTQKDCNWACCSKSLTEKDDEDRWTHRHVHEISLRWHLTLCDGVLTLSYWKQLLDDLLGKLWPWRDTITPPPHKTADTRHVEFMGSCCWCQCTLSFLFLAEGQGTRDDLQLSALRFDMLFTLRCCYNCTEKNNKVFPSAVATLDNWMNEQVYSKLLSECVECIQPK